MGIFSWFLGKANTTQLAMDERRRIYADFEASWTQLRQMGGEKVIMRNLGPGRSAEERASIAMAKAIQSGEMERAWKEAEKAAIAEVAKRHHVSKSTVSSIVSGWT